MNLAPSFSLTTGHQRLLALVGAWSGEEEMQATQWAPAGRATTKVTAEAEFGGLFVSQRYRQFRDGQESFSSHNIFCFDHADGLVKMFQFDSMGFVPASPATGAWTDDGLVLERISPRGSARMSYAFESPDRYRTWLKFRPAGDAGWQDMANGVLRRVSSPDGNKN